MTQKRKSIYILFNATYVFFSAYIFAKDFQKSSRKEQAERKKEKKKETSNIPFDFPYGDLRCEDRLEDGFVKIQISIASAVVFHC